ncbi:MAG: glycosyltransferase family 39 protein [Microgenomates group bacterium]
MRSSHRLLITLTGIILLGAILRLINVSDTFFFGYDQARDIHEVYEMVTLPKLKVVGPGTDIPGLFSGPLFYYLLAIPYTLFNFNPNSAILLLILINLSGIPLLYYLGKKMGGQTVGFIASILWATSFEQANFSRFLSNPSFLSIIAIILFFGLYTWCVEKKWWGLPLSVIGLGLGTQLDFYLIYLIMVYPLVYFLFKPSLNKKNIVWSLICGGLLFSTFLIAEIKFKFIGTTSFLNYLLTHQSQGMSFQGMLFINSLNKSIHNALFALPSYWPLVLFALVLIGLLLSVKDKKIKIFLLVWLLSTAPLFVFKGTNVVGGNFVHSTIQPAITLIIAFFISHLSQSRYKVLALFILSMIVISNLTLFIKDNFKSSFVLGHQNMLHYQQKKLVDYTYEKAMGKPFSICSVSDPLFINGIWSALYKLYGERKYGYMPTWAGPPQLQSKTFLSKDAKHEPLRFLIIEPSFNYPSHVPQITEYSENNISKVMAEKQFGGLRIQMRQLLPESEWNKQMREEQYEQILLKDDRYRCYFTY